MSKSTPTKPGMTKWKAQPMEEQHAARVRSDASGRRRVVERARAKAEKKIEKVTVKDAGISKGAAELKAALEEAKIMSERGEDKKPLSTESDELFLDRMAHAINGNLHNKHLRDVYIRITAKELLRRGWTEGDIKAAMTERTIFGKRLK